MKISTVKYFDYPIQPFFFPLFPLWVGNSSDDGTYNIPAKADSP